MDNIELKQYEEGNFLSIYIGAKPIIKFAMLRLENFISYYLRGPGGLDCKSEVLDIDSYAREIFYIEQTDAHKIENWIVYYDVEHDFMAVRHCFWDKALDRDILMADESLRGQVREKYIVDKIPHISNQTIIDVDETVKHNILNSINDFDVVISEISVLELFKTVDYSIGDYKITRSYDLDVRLEAIIREEQRGFRTIIEKIKSLILEILKVQIAGINDYKIVLDYQFSPIDIK